MIETSGSIQEDLPFAQSESYSNQFSNSNSHTASFPDQSKPPPSFQTQSLDVIEDLADSKEASDPVIQILGSSHKKQPSVLSSPSKVLYSSKFNNSQFIDTIEESLPAASHSHVTETIQSTSILGSKNLQARVVGKSRLTRSAQKGKRADQSNANLGVIEQSAEDDENLTQAQVNAQTKLLVDRKLRKLNKDQIYGFGLKDLDQKMRKKHLGTLVQRAKKCHSKPEEEKARECHLCEVTALSDLRIPMQKVNQLFMDDFYKMKHQQMVAQIRADDEDPSTVEYRRVLEDYATKVETSSHINKVLQKLKYK